MQVAFEFLESIFEKFNSFELPDFKHILNLWTFNNSASEVTTVIQGFLSRLPTFYLGFFAISFLIIVLGLLISLASKIL